MIVQVIGAFFAVITIAVIFQTPKKYLVYAGLTGSIGWMVYLLSIKYGMENTIAMFSSTMVVALISHSFARLFKAPVTVFLIAGILPMVPGLGMYRIVSYLILGDRAKAAYYFTETISIAGMIALAIFIMDTIFRLFQKN